MKYQGVTRYRSLPPSVEVVQVAHLEKHPHICTLLEVDLSLLSPRPLGYGSLANPLTVPNTWTHILSGGKCHVCPPEIPHEYHSAYGGNPPMLTIDNDPVSCQSIHP